MSNVIPFRSSPEEVRSQNPTAQAPCTSKPSEVTVSPRSTNVSKPRRKTATLELKPTARCGKVKGFGEGHFEGTLTCSGRSLSFQDGSLVGVAAFVMNIGSVQVRLPSYPDETFKLRASRVKMPSGLFRLLELLQESSNKGELEDRRRREEALFIIRLEAALWMSWSSIKETRSQVDYLERERLFPILEQMPPELQVNVRLARATYDQHGQPLSQRQLEQAARLFGSCAS